MNDRTASPKRRPRRRFLPGRIVLALLVLLAGLVVWLRVGDLFGDRGSTNFFSLVAVLTAVVVWLLWFLFRSALRLWARLLAVAGLVAAVWVFFSVYRVDFVTGEMVPSFALRTAPRPHETLAAPEAEKVVDLSTTGEDDFPGFLGRHRALEVRHVGVDRGWSKRPPEELWRRPIGAGWSGFAVVNGYAVTMEQRGNEELVTCYDARTGELQWSHGVETAFTDTVFGDGPRATPEIAGAMVYAQGATGRLAALDGATGEPVWDKDLNAEAGMTPEEVALSLPYGRSGSPLVAGDLVVVPLGGPADGPQASLVAYDKKTGEEVWRGGDEQISCSSPTLATVDGVEQILSVNEASVTGHDPATGRVLWRRPWEGRTNANASVSQAVPLWPDKVFLSKGYGVGAALLELAAQDDGTLAVTELWHNPRVLRTKFTNAALFKGHAYGLSDGILECVDLETGERVWKKGRYRQGQILRVRERLLVLAESGELSLVEARPDEPNSVLGQVQALEGKTWNTLALYGEILLVRNAREAAAYRLALQGRLEIGG